MNGTTSDGSALTGAFAGFAGHLDWRLPTIVELLGIRDVNAAGCGGTGPCIDPIFGPTQANVYWSATTDAGSPTLAWDATSPAPSRFPKTRPAPMLFGLCGPPCDRSVAPLIPPALSMHVT